MFKVLSALVLACALASFGSLRAEEKGGAMRVYVSGYHQDITCFEFDSKSGELKKLSASVGGKNPSYLAFHPNGKYLYSCNENNPEGKVTAFSINPADGSLTKLSEASSAGPGPCHVYVHPSGKWVFSANYTGGTIGVLPIKEDGSVGEPVQKLAPGAKSHEMMCDASGKHVFAPCLGANIVTQFNFDEKTGQLTPNTPPSIELPAGAGPRHITFAPGEANAYITNELDLTVTACAYDNAKGLLTILNTQTQLPVPKEKGWSSAHVVVTPNGKFVYTSNRGHNSISIFKRDPDKGTLTLTANENGGGDVSVPRDFTLDPSGSYMLVANQHTSTVTVFRCNADTGALAKLNTIPVPNGPSFAGFWPGVK